MAESLTTEILIQIRDEIRKTREDVSARIDSTRVELSARIDTTNARVDRLEQRQTEDSIRLATELVGVARAVQEVRDLLREDRQLRTQVAEHEKRIDKLERRSA